jgi:hypothetical protein
MAEQIEPISPEQARKILDSAIRQRIGEHWEDDDNGWTLVTGHDYMARLTRGRKNLDFYVDLVGEVTVEEKEINPAQEYGRLVAWAFLVASLVIALMIARIAGYI